MSTTIDQKVVEMRFDNSNFENNVKTSMSTLDKLKKALKFDGASKGLEDVQKCANKVNFSGMSRSVDAMTQKFSYMQMTIQHQLNNIVDSAVNAGKRMVSALTIDPVKSGLQEYETQINAVQTILANTQHNGTTLDEVNNALDTLNTYADKTIYNFTEMTRNIGTFTAAGVDLQTSVDSIQGIANLAAVSGSTSQQASTAMHQLSQALAAGKVSLMDWNSVVNAGMGGKVFQDALIRTSELLKTGAKDAIATSGSFRESLTKTGWLTTEVLTETLKQFAGAYSEAELISQGFTEKQAKEIANMAETATNAATKVKTFTQLWDTLKEAAQSGWTQTWELIIGDFNEAQELLTKISDKVGAFIGKMSDSRNELLGGALKSPWKNFTEGLVEAGVSVDTFQNKVRELYDASKGKEGSFDKLIEKEGSFEKACRSGAISSDMLKNAVKNLAGGFSDLSDVQKNLKMGDTGEDVKKVQQALSDLGYEFKKYGVDGIIGEETEGIIKQFQEMNGLEVTGIVDEATLKALEEASKKTGSFKGNVDELIDSLDKMGGREKIIESLGKIAQQIGLVFKAIGTAFRNIFPPMTSENLTNIINKFHEFATSLKMDGKTFGKIRRIFEGLFSVLHIVSTLAGGALKIGFSLLSKVLSAFGTDVLGLIANIADMITAFHDWLFEGNILATMIDGLIAKLPEFVDRFKEWMTGFKETPAVQKFVEALGKIKKVFSVLATMELNSDSITHWITNLKNYFVELAKSIPGLIKQLVSDVINGLDGLTGGAITKFKKFITMFADTPELQALASAMARLGRGISGLISTISGIASSIYDKAVSIGQNIIQGLQNGLGDGIGSVVSKIIEVATNLINAFCDMLGIHSPSTVAYEWGHNIIQGLVNGIKDFISIIADAFSSLGDKIKGLADKIPWENIFEFVNNIKEYAKNLDWGKIIAGGITIGSFVTINKICGLLETLTSPLSSISNVIDAFADTIAGVGKAYQKNLKADSLMKIAIAIGVLVAAIAALVYVAGDNYGQIWNAVGVIVVLAGVLAALSVAMDKLGSAAVSFENNGLKINGMKKSLVSLGIAIVLLAVAVKLIGGLDPETAKQGFIGLAELMVSILAFLGVSSVIAKKGGDIKSFGKTMKQIAIAMLLMLAVIKLASMMDPADILIGMMVVEAFVLITAQMAIANRIAGGNAVKFGKTMKQMATAMLMMLAVIKLSSMMNPSDLVIGIAVIEVFVLIGIEMGIANRIAGGNATKFGGTMMKMALSMLILVGVVKILSMMDAETIIKGLLAVQAFVLVIAEMLLIAKLGGKSSSKIASTIMSMAIAIGLMAGVCVLISMIDTTQLAKGLVAISILGAIMTAMVWAARGVGDAKVAIIGMAAAIAIMTGAIVALSFIKPEKLVPAVVALSTLMLMFGIMTNLASGAKASIGALLSITVVVVLLTGLLFAINALKIKGAIETVVSISILLLSMAVSLRLMSGIQSVSVSALVSIGVLTIIVAALAGILKLINVLDVQASLPTVVSLSVLLLALSAATVILSTVGAGAASAVAGAVGLAGVILVIGGLMVGLGALVTYIPQVEEFLNNGIPVLEAIGVGIGKFIGGFIGGVGSGFAEQLPPISAAIKEFVNNFVGINTSAVDGAKALAEVISAIGVSSITDGIASILNFSKENPIEQFATNAGALVDAVKGISEKLNGVTINEEALEQVAKVGTAFTTLANSIPATEGLLQKLNGIKDLAGFGTSIASYVGEIQKVNDAVNSEGYVFNSEGITAFATVGSSFATLVNSLPITDGWLQKITGIKNLSGFGASIAAYAGEIQKVNDAVNVEGFTFNSEAIVAFATVGTSFSTLMNSLPSTDGWLEKITGIKDLSGFGTSIASYIGEMKTVAESIGDDFSLNSEAIGQMVTAGQKLAELQESLPSMGGVIAFFSGEQQDLGTFGTNIGLFADAMGKLKEGMGENGISDAVVTSITNAGNALLALNDALPTEGWFDGKITMSEFSDYISDFSTAISDFSVKASEIDDGGITTAINAAYQIKNLIGYLADLDTSGVVAFTGIGTGGIGADGAAYKIAEAMAAFSTKVADIDTAAVSTASTAAIRIKNLIAGLVGLDTSGVENFKPQTIGSAIKSYADKVKGIDTGTVSSSISAANQLKTFIASLSGLDSSGISNFNLLSIGTAIKSYANNVAGIDIAAIVNSISAANKLKSFIGSLAGLDTSGVSSFKSAVSSLGSMNLNDIASSLGKSTSSFTSVGSGIADSLTKGMKSKSSSLTSTVSSMITAMVNAIKAKNGKFQASGTALIGKLIAGISSQKSKVSSTMTSTINSAVTSIRNKYISFYSAGAHLGSGLIIGINSKQQAAYNAGYALGQAAVQGEKDGQASNSPSKLTIKAGKWLGEGLVIGISRMSKAVYKSGNTLGESAVGSISSAIARVSDMVGSGIDANPMIRPVLDLSEVESGVSAMGSMLNMNSSVGVMANIGAIGSMMNQRNQNGVNDDVVSAINKLRKELGNVGGTTYNVNGITYDDGSNISDAVKSIVRAARVERRV